MACHLGDCKLMMPTIKVLLEDREIENVEQGVNLPYNANPEGFNFD